MLNLAVPLLVRQACRAACLARLPHGTIAIERGGTCQSTPVFQCFLERIHGGTYESRSKWRRRDRLSSVYSHC